MDLESCKRVTLSCCILHNFLKTIYSNDHQEEDEKSALESQEAFAEDDQELLKNLSQAEKIFTSV